MEEGKLIDETGYAGCGDENPEVLMYNDYDYLKDLPDFDANNKLHRVKLWHEPGLRITGMELTYINPHTKEFTRPGAHISSDFDDDRMQAETLELDLDEYIEEVRGFHSHCVHSLFLRTSHGQFVDVGKTQSGREFKFRISKGYLVHSFTIGISTNLVFLGLVTMPVTAMPRVAHTKSLPGVGAAIRPVIVTRSDYFGASFTDALITDDFFLLNAQQYLKRNRFRMISLECIFTDHVLGLNVGYLVKKEKKYSGYNFSLAAQHGHSDLQREKMVLDEDEWIAEISGYASKSLVTQLEVTTNKQRKATWGRVEKKATRFEMTTETEKMVLALRGVYAPSGLIALMAYFIDINRDRPFRIIE